MTCRPVTILNKTEPALQSLHISKHGEEQAKARAYQHLLTRMGQTPTNAKRLVGISE